MRDPYEVLGVPRGASAAAIKSAYRKLAKKHHPDNNNNDPKAAARFSEINSANEIIGDEDKRKQFDRGEIDAEGKPRFQGFSGSGFGGGNARGRAGGAGGFESHSFRTGGGAGGAGGAGFEDILNSMFGGAAKGGRPGGGRTFEFDTGGIGLDLDLNVAMAVSLEESVKGGEKRVRLPTGKELNVKIPAGVTAGQQIRLKGQGETAPGHPPGDLLITVSIAPHAFFKVDGSDLRLDLPITLYEAVLGGKVRVPTLGSAVGQVSVVPISVATVREPPSFIASSALMKKLRKTCSIWSASGASSTSIGLPCDQNGGSVAFSRLSVAGES